MFDIKIYNKMKLSASVMHVAKKTSKTNKFIKYKT